MSIYISRNKSVPDSFLEEFKAHLRIIEYSSSITYWDRNEQYSDKSLRAASMVIFLLNSSSTEMGKGGFSEYELAKQLGTPHVLAYKTKNNGFQFYSFSVDETRRSFTNYAIAIFGSNCSSQIHRALLELSGKAVPYSTNKEVSCSEFDIGALQERKLHIELLLLRR